ncbi:hypothetical protein RBSH_00317 [Rhodopirellula baltica SH28]|uniref:Uncharacterized protein n=1 Tax=Rhodopirellula baltica SH28 TaxID=993517 RepID=K5CJV7_RHOBT|nr:hypothetical protein RBSH_00317 [Rhodopirellula baltica SH28]
MELYFVAQVKWRSIGFPRTSIRSPKWRNRGVGDGFAFIVNDTSFDQSFLGQRELETEGQETSQDK